MAGFAEGSMTDAIGLMGQPIFAVPIHHNYVPPSIGLAPNVARGTEFLKDQEWPMGLISCFFENLHRVPMRFFICDDSGSMTISDGHRLLGVGTLRKMVPSSRWGELTDSLRFHATIASRANAPTEFRFLNMGQPITLGVNDTNEAANLDNFLQLLEESPSGGTPLCRHIREVTDRIRVLEPQLRATNTKACVIIATDGEASDGDLTAALRPLKDLPVMLVLRLCTDNDGIVNYWNNIDKELELNMDVLDDLMGEAQEVHEVNPWLTYGQPLHQLREFGVTAKEMDLLDERLLSEEEFHHFCIFLFGHDAKAAPNPLANWNSFIRMIDHINHQLPEIWSPTAKKNKNWVNCSKFSKSHNRGGCNLS